MNVLSTILQGNNGDLVKQLAQQFGVGEGEAASTIEKLVPQLSQGIKNNLSKEGGLESLLGALTNGNHSKYIDQADQLGQDTRVADGNSILGHIFGSKDTSRAVAGAAASETGLDSGIVKQMLPVVATMVMGALSKQSSNAGALSSEAGGLGSGLDLLTSFLDSDKDGSVADDLLNMAKKLF